MNEPHEMKVSEVSIPVQVVGYAEEPPFDWLAAALGIMVGVGLGFALCWHWQALQKAVGL